MTICDKADVRFFAGDWSEIDKLLPHVGTDVKHNQGAGYDFILMAETVYSINSLQGLYNLIKKVSFCSLTRAKLYFYIEPLQCKYENIFFVLVCLSIEVFDMQCLKRPDGVVYMAAKKYYFGVGGGTRQFLSVVEKDGELVLTFGYIVY